MRLLTLAFVLWSNQAWSQDDTGQPRPRPQSHLSKAEPLGSLGRHEYVVEGTPHYLGVFQDEVNQRFVHMVGVTRVLRHPAGRTPPTRVMWSVPDGCAMGRDGVFSCSETTDERPVQDGVRGVFFMSEVTDFIPASLKPAAQEVPLVVSLHRFHEVKTPYGSVCRYEVSGSATAGTVLWIQADGTLVGVLGWARDAERVKAEFQAEVGADAWVRDNAGEVLGLKYDVVVERIRQVLAR